MVFGSTDTKAGVYNNTNEFRDSSITRNRGGDRFHGAGALDISSVFVGCENCQSVDCNTLIHNTTFMRNVGGSTGIIDTDFGTTDTEPGTAGGIRVRLAGC